ncbi:MAG: hypothetical protein ACK5JF_06980 [Oscillospiraceae bacterium]
MKRKSKVLMLSLCLVIVLLTALSVTVLAEGIINNGIELYVTTNKQAYTKDEDVELNIMVKNTTLDPITDVVITPYIPDGFEVQPELGAKAAPVDVIGIDECSVKEVRLMFTGVTGPATSSSTPTSSSSGGGSGSSGGTGGAGGAGSASSSASVSTTSPKTGDGMLTIAMIILGTGVACLAVLLVIKFKNKKASKMLALLLVTGLTVSAAAMLPVSVQAGTVEESITAYSSFTVDGQKYSIGATVSYCCVAPVTEDSSSNNNLTDRPGSSASSEATRPVGMHGVIKLKDDVPLEGVTIRLREGYDNKTGEYAKDANGNIIEVITGEDGKFLIEVLEGRGKTYTVEFSKPGYVTHYANGTLQENHYVYLLMIKA